MAGAFQTVGSAMETQIVGMEVTNLQIVTVRSTVHNFKILIKRFKTINLEIAVCLAAKNEFLKQYFDFNP